jgi:hypothetical protein
MNAATAFLRGVFLASAFASSMFFLLSVLPSAVQHSEYSLYVATALSCVIALAFCFRLIRSGLLASPAVGLYALFKAFVKSLAWSYLKLAAVIGLVFLVTLSAVGVSLKDAGALSGLFAFWLALCMAPAMASLATGRKLTGKAQNGA